MSNSLREVLQKIGSEYLDAKQENFTRHALGNYARMLDPL
jgi:hypothetical protein